MHKTCSDIYKSVPNSQIFQKKTVNTLIVTFFKPSHR